MSGTEVSRPLADAGVKRLVKAAADWLTAMVRREEAAIAAAEAAAANTPPLPPPSFRDRAAVIRECDLSPEHIIGSWFMALEDGEVTMHGLVLAQIEARPQNDARYLLQLFKDWPEMAKKDKQVIVPQSRMLLGYVSEEKDRMGLAGSSSEWRFFDTDEELKQAWIEMALEREQERNAV